jgi:hypothetical protein
MPCHPGVPRNGGHSAHTMNRWCPAPWPSREDQAIVAVETLLLSGLFILVDVPEMAWNLHIENQIAKQVAAFIG